jgi:hypothetical protein
MRMRGWRLRWMGVRSFPLTPDSIPSPLPLLGRTQCVRDSSQAQGRGVYHHQIPDPQSHSKNSNLPPKAPSQAPHVLAYGPATS